MLRIFASGDSGKDQSITDLDAVRSSFKSAPQPLFSEGRPRILFLLSKLAVLLILCSLAGCATTSFTIPAPPSPTPSGQFLAGAAKVDITPPPGYPMGGHSLAGRIGRGVWLRLYARSIFLEDPAGVRVVMVSADLWSIPAGLVDRVAQLISEQNTACVVGRSGLIIAATHTHQSPANFSSSPAYNAFASPMAGFDPDLFEFLAQRIVSSIETACENKEEAKLFYNESRMTNQPFARNRSFEAFLHDQEAVSILNTNTDLPDGPLSPEYPFVGSYRAIDPSLRVLRIKRAIAPEEDIAIAGFVSVHNTSLTHEAEVYNSDLMGFSSVMVERSLISSGKSPVVALFNGAEGDISPAWNTQDRRDTSSLGQYLATSILALPPGRPLQGKLNYRFALAPLNAECIPCRTGQWGDAFPCPKEELLCTAQDPLAGVPMLGGAEDGRTIFRDLSCREGVKDNSDTPPHGSKRPMLACLDTAYLTVRNALTGREAPSSARPSSPGAMLLTELFSKAVSVPKIMPIGIYSIDSLTLATLPGEFTTVMGRRITEEIKTQMPIKPANVALVGLANEYLSYFATPEEYQEQAYEGASTLYGVGAGELVRHKIGQLAAKLDGNPPSRDTQSTRSYEVGTTKHFGIHTLPEQTDFFGTGFRPILTGLDTGIPNFRRLPAFCWDDKETMLLKEGNANHPVTPRVSVMGKEASLPHSENRVLGSDDGVEFLTILGRHQGDSIRWCSMWFPPVQSNKEDRVLFRFRVEAPSGLTFESHECVLTPEEVVGPCTIMKNMHEGQN